MDLILAIAALCAIPNGSTVLQYTQNRQLACQQYYIKCMKSTPTIRLADCILLKKPLKD